MGTRVRPAFEDLLKGCMVLCLDHRQFVSNYRRARAYPLPRRSAFHWAWRCAEDGVNVDEFLAESFRMEMARHGVEDRDAWDHG